MGTILLHESMVNKEQTSLVEEERNKIKRETGANTRKTRVRLKYLNRIAREERLSRSDIYEKKIKHLKRKYQEDRDRKLDMVPKDIKEYADAKIFSRTAYEEIEKVRVEVITVGDIELSQEEEEVLRMHPKFAVLEKLDVQEI